MEFRIEKDKYYAEGFIIRGIKNVISPIMKNSIVFKATLNGSIFYEFDPENEGLQWNKLYGLCSARGPHYNSARFVWRVNNGILEIAAYTYIKGERTVSSPLYRRELSSESKDFSLDLGMTIEKDRIYYLIGDSSGIYMSMLDEGFGSKLLWRLYPYFGGAEPAPYSMYLVIDEYPGVLEDMFFIPKDRLEAI